MRFLLISLILSSCIFAQNWSMSNRLNFVYKNFAHSKNTTSALFQNKLKYTHDNCSFFSNIIGQKDIDIPSRSFIDLFELYARYEDDSYSVVLGKEIKHWGALEEYNIVDVFNRNEYRIDFLDQEKRGSFHLSYRYFFENENIVSFMVKVGEEKDIFPDAPYPFYPFGSLSYDANFQTQSYKDRPSIFIKLDGHLPNLDYSFVYVNGYDNQRDYIIENTSYIVQYLYFVEKYLGYATYQNGALLYKAEIAYTDVKNYKNIADYCQWGIGIEYDQNYHGFDIQYLAEYYKYHQVNPKNTRSINDLFIIFQNDIFLSTRLSLQSYKEQTLEMSLLLDMDDNKEKLFRLSYSQRAWDDFIFDISYSKITPSTDNTTYFHLTGEQDIVKVSVSYHF